MTSQYTETSSLSDHNILLANVDVPEYNTGLNKLLHSVQVRRCDRLVDLTTGVLNVCTVDVNAVVNEYKKCERR